MHYRAVPSPPEEDRGQQLKKAADMLRNAGYDIPENNGESYAMMTKYDHDAEDVKRKKDL